MRLFQHHYASLREGKETRTVFLKKVLIDGSELTDAFKKRFSVEKGTILGKNQSIPRLTHLYQMRFSYSLKKLISLSKFYRQIIFKKPTENYSQQPESYECLVNVCKVRLGLKMSYLRS